MNNLFAVYDSCSGIFGEPFVAVNEASAIRMFEFALANADLPKFIRDDTVLYCIGCYDNKTGYVSYDSAPYVVIRGSSVVLPDVSLQTPSDSEVIHNEE